MGRDLHTCKNIHVHATYENTCVKNTVKFDENGPSSNDSYDPCLSHLINELYHQNADSQFLQQFIRQVRLCELKWPAKTTRKCSCEDKYEHTRLFTSNIALRHYRFILFGISNSAYREFTCKCTPRAYLECAGFN